MNWNKLKEKYPNSYNEIREFSIANNKNGSECFNRFLDSKGYLNNLLRINQLKDYEQKIKRSN